MFAFIKRYFHRAIVAVDTVLMTTILVILPFYLDNILKVWSFFCIPLVNFLLYVGLISHVSYPKYIAQWSKENAYFSFSSWVHSGWLLRHVDDKPDLVIASYKENISWLEDYFPYVNHVYLYCKDQEYCARGITQLVATHPDRFTITHLPNVGREAHTYLHHILTHYDALPQRTVFTMASVHTSWLRALSLRYALSDVGKMHKCVQFKQSMMNKLYRYEVTVGKLPMSLGEGYDRYAVSPIIAADTRPLGPWLQKYIGVDIRSLQYRCGLGMHGAIFSTTRDRLHTYTKEQYASLFALNAVGDSLEAGYYLEVSWRFLLGHKANG